jgi:uncharacterized damage-inducible protein DinB
MTPQMTQQQWQHLLQVLGVGLRAVEAIPADRIHSRPIPNMRTPAELAMHMFSLAKGVAEGMVRGEIPAAAGEEQSATVKTHADLVGYCLECCKAADSAVRQVTDAHLAATVKTPWGITMPGSACLGVIGDEFLHHRGQLYAYLRAMGVAPPMIWDFAGNAPEFRPGAAQTA